MNKLLYLICKIGDILFCDREKVLPIFFYHSIADNDSNLSISPEIFRAQIEYLKLNGYESIGVDKVLEGEFKKKVMICFDDGMRDVALNALPILNKAGFKAVVFLSTDFIGKKAEFCRKESDKNFQMLNESDIKTLAKAGWQIANHFAGHKDLVDLTEVEMYEEYNRAVSTLKLLVKDKALTNYVSYPHNKYNQRVLKIMHKLKVKAGFAGLGLMYNKDKDDKLAIPRIEITKEVTMQKFKLYLSPTFHALKRIKYR